MVLQARDQLLVSFLEFLNFLRVHGLRHLLQVGEARWGSMPKMGQQPWAGVVFRLAAVAVRATGIALRSVVDLVVANEMALQNGHVGVGFTTYIARDLVIWLRCGNRVPLGVEYCFESAFPITEVLLIRLMSAVPVPSLLHEASERPRVANDVVDPILSGTVVDGIIGITCHVPCKPGKIIN